MIVCVCNVINCAAVREQIAKGAASAECVYRALGITPQCRTCSDCIESMIDDFSAGQMVAAE